MNYNYLTYLKNIPIDMCQSMDEVLKRDPDGLKDAYKTASESPLDNQQFEGKCVVVKAITNKFSTLHNLKKANDDKRCNVKRVGVEYLKLQEFFGGFKASFCRIQGNDSNDQSSRRRQIRRDFIHKIKESRDKFSEYNTGLIPLPDEQSKKVRKNDYSNFEGPIKSIKLTNVNGSNKSTYFASIDGNNKCVIKSLNRYIHKTKQPSQPDQSDQKFFSRLMINEMHFKADRCVINGRKYLAKLKELEADDDPGNNKKSGDNIDIKYVKPD